MMVQNMHVAGICSRGSRFWFETAKAASSNIAATSAADIIRANAFLDAIEFYLDYVVGAPLLDLPESSPRDYEVAALPEVSKPENESFVDLMTMWELLMIEMANSQSARMPSGIIVHDEKRCRDLITSSRNFLSNYVANVQPLDLPESAPLRPNTGSGRTGT